MDDTWDNPYIVLSPQKCSGRISVHLWLTIISLKSSCSTWGQNSLKWKRNRICWMNALFGNCFSWAVYEDNFLIDSPHTIFNSRLSPYTPWWFYLLILHSQQLQDCFSQINVMWFSAALSMNTLGFLSQCCLQITVKSWCHVMLYFLSVKLSNNRWGNSYGQMFSRDDFTKSWGGWEWEKRVGGRGKGEPVVLGSHCVQLEEQNNNEKQTATEINMATPSVKSTWYLQDNIVASDLITGI